jgi:hypothetical protein
VARRPAQQAFPTRRIGRVRHELYLATITRKPIEQKKPTRENSNIRTSFSTIHDHILKKGLLVII